MANITLTKRFDDALLMATRLHGRKTRKGTGIPYVSHLLAVASIVLENGTCEDEAIAALLHDGPEDCRGRETLEEIHRDFGEQVEKIVKACTDTFERPKPEWRPRKEEFIASLPDKPEGALLVCLADKLHNARSILADYRSLGEKLWDRFTGKKEGTLWYYRKITDVYKKIGNPKLAHLVEELDRVVREVERLSL